jgi:hypothetical protein
MESWRHILNSPWWHRTPPSQSWRLCKGIRYLVHSQPFSHLWLCWRWLWIHQQMLGRWRPIRQTWVEGDQIPPRKKTIINVKGSNRKSNLDEILPLSSSQAIVLKYQLNHGVCSWYIKRRYLVTVLTPLPNQGGKRGFVKQPWNAIAGSIK